MISDSTQMSIGELNAEPPDNFVTEGGIYRHRQLPNRTKRVNPHAGLHNFPPLEDVRKPVYRGNSDDLYDSLINIILNHKKDLRKIPSAITLAGAERYATGQGKGWRAKEVDLNPQDGLDEKEVVVYNPAGRPTVINGYKLGNSDYGYKKAYLSANPGGYNNELQQKVTYKEYLDGVFGQTTAREHPWSEIEEGNSRPAEFNKIFDQGYARKLPKKRKLAVNQIFSKIFSQTLKGIVVENANEHPIYTIWNKVVPALPFSQLAFILMFDQNVYAEVMRPGTPWKDFKANANANKDVYEQFLYEHYIDLEHNKIRDEFAQNIIDMVLTTQYDGELIQDLLMNTVAEVLTIGGILLQNDQLDEARVNNPSAQDKFYFKEAKDLVSTLIKHITNELKAFITTGQGNITLSPNGQSMVQQSRNRSRGVSEFLG